MSKEEQNMLYLVDGSGYLYRAFHALPPLSTSDGRPTGAIYGVANMLRKLRTEAGSARIVVVFDAKGPTFRDELFDQYKANRPKMPEDLATQIEPLVALVEAMGFPVLRISGVEADDVIGTLATQAKGPTVISTSDKDLAQLVNERVHLVNTMTGKTLDPAGVEAKFGVPPERIVDYLALVGDTSDNIPGVPKVGPKTAAKWLVHYGDLDAVVAHAEEISGKVGESLRDHLQQLELSRDLARIRTDCKLDAQIEDLKTTDADSRQLAPLLREHEFLTWLDQLGPATKEVPETAYELLTDEASFKAWVEKLTHAEAFAFDTETTSLDYMRAELVGVSFCMEAGHAAYVPVAHDYAGAPSQLNRDQVLNALKPLLESKKPTKVCQHGKYDMNVLHRCGIKAAGLHHDTMLESYVLDATATRHDMDSLAIKYLNRNTVKYADVAGKGAKQLTFNQVPLQQAGPYAAEDADVTWQLHQTLYPRVKAEPGLKRVYEELEIPLIPVLSAMELAGVLVDKNLLLAQSKQLAERMVELERSAHKAAGGQFKLSSPLQLQQILFEKLKLPVKRKTPKGKPSTAEDVLAELAQDDFVLPQIILDYRQLAKLKSTYTDRLPQRVNPQTGRVHTSYHQAVASTGRLSSSEPNLQNIPIRTEEGRRIRKAFIAPEGCVILAADYSQIELRLMAHFSDDQGLLTAFKEGRDVHRATAAEVFGVAEKDVLAGQRRAAKAINFGLMYGMSAFGLGRQLKLDRAEARDYVDRYFKRYPGVRDYMERTREQARKDGFVETLMGRRLYLPEINAGNGQRRQAAERAAINAPLQGTAADIIKRAMIDLHRWLGAQDRGARMVMQVHDELVLEVKEDAVEKISGSVRERMETAADLKVPLEVKIGIGSNWDEAH